MGTQLEASDSRSNSFLKGQMSAGPGQPYTRGADKQARYLKRKIVKSSDINKNGSGISMSNSKMG